jgi:hypothetical protein
MKKIYASIFALFTTLNLYAGAPTKVISGNINGTVNWVADTIYILSGKVFLKNGATLNIAPGTIIKADTNVVGTALIVTRGSKLNAIGTPDKPIVFTPNAPVGKRRPAMWGGICIAGNAKVNVAGGEAPFEGGNLTNPDGSTTDDKYGGLNDADNSGTLKYVRIEYAGYPYQQNNELNSLTCGGVGNGTTIDYVQTSFGFDDAFEFFGGTVNAKHLVSFKGNDDDFDTDFGYSGKIQYGVVFRDTALADPVSGANCFESDNDGTGSSAKPYTAPIFSNITVVGAKRTPTTIINSNHRRGAHIRRNSRMSLFNSVIMCYPTGIKIDGDSCHNNADSNLLEIKNTVLAECGNLLDSTAGQAWNITSWFNSSSSNNEVVPNASALQLNNYISETAFNLLPTSTSPLLNGASFTAPKLNNPYFDVVNFRGAFGTTNWMENWTNFDPQNEPYEYGYGVSPNSIATSIFSNTTIVPNPAKNNFTIIGLPNSVNYSIYTITNKLVKSGILNNNELIDVENLNAGIYIVMLSIKNNTKHNIKLEIH